MDQATTVQMIDTYSEEIIQLIDNSKDVDIKGEAIKIVIKIMQDTTKYVTYSK